MNNNSGCLFFIITPALVYWTTAIVAFIKLLENDIFVLKALGLSVIWPLALIDEIVRAITTFP